MENIALTGLADNLRSAMDDIIVRRVVQHHPNGFILYLRSARLPAFKILMNAQNPAFYASDSKPPMESPNSDFLMVLRKHFTSAELLEFRKPLSDRVLELVFKTAVPSRELEVMTLVVELIPNAPNIILLDAERRVLSSFSPITPQHGIGEFEPYALPPTGDKIALDAILAAETPELEEQQPGGRAWLMSRVAGLGPVFADEVLFRARKTGRPAAQELKALLQQVRTPPHAGWIYTEKPLAHLLDQNDVKSLSRAIVSPVELQSLERTHSSRGFAKIADAARFYFDEMESRTLLEHAKLPLLRDLRTAAKRLADREKRLTREQRKYDDAEKVQKTAQLLTSSGMRMDQRYESVSATDYFREDPAPVTIELDGALTLRENIDRMFKLHQKAGRGKQIVARQLDAARHRSQAVAEQIRRLQAIKDWDTWRAISDRIDKERTNPQAAAKADAPLNPIKKFRSLMAGDREILVGRSGRDNDELTFSVAAADDFWLHVADYSGSHVIVRNPSRDKELPDDVLMKAAQLAAYFSQARNTSKVEVHVTRRKFVTKPRRAKPGLVRLLEFKSVTVEPRNWLEE